MRTEQEMFDLILQYAQQDENIRVVVLNGSRANPNIQGDFFQDFDIVFYARDPSALIRNQALILYFGEMMILQLPDEMGVAEFSGDERYAYLMQFLDGNRIDLSICPMNQLEANLAADSLTVILLDKDGRVKKLPPPSEQSYLPKKPTPKMFEDCCNEFWWLNPYTAKGLWRGELIYAKYALDNLMRGELMKMLEWYFGIRTGFSRAMGKQGKFLPEVLDRSEWDMLGKTYADFDSRNIWISLLMMGDLFRKVASLVADYFGFSYPLEEDQRVTAFLHQVRESGQYCQL